MAFNASSKRFSVVIKRIWFKGISFTLWLFFASVPDLAIAEKTILFGQSAALTGSASHLGLNMRKGILRAFEEANKKGGIQGYRLKLKSLDDLYEPEQAVKNTYQLIEQHKVFALIGAVGTPTSKAVLPILLKTGLPYIAPFTGARFLREPLKKNIINIRASYHQEASYIVERLLSDRKIKKISILYQDDSYGREGLNALETALKKQGMSIVSKGSYMRNTSAVKTALLDIMSARPEAVVIAGAYGPTADFIKLTEVLSWRPVFVSLSFVGTEALYKALPQPPSPLFISQVVPFPYNKNCFAKAPHCDKHKREDFNFVSLEGYIAGRLVISALEKSGPPESWTREKFLASIRKTKDLFVTEDFSLNFEAQGQQGSNRVFLTTIDKGKLLPVPDLKVRDNEH